MDGELLPLSGNAVYTKYSLVSRHENVLNLLTFTALSTKHDHGTLL